MSRGQDTTIRFRKASLQGGVVRLQERKIQARCSNSVGVKRRRMRLGHIRTLVGWKLLSQLSGQAKAAGTGRILFRRGRGLGRVAGLRNRKPREIEKDRGATTRHRSSQTYRPLNIFLERATRNRSASLSASERASLRPADVIL